MILARSASLGIQLPEGTGPGTIAIRKLDPTEVTPGEFACLVQHAVEQEGARVIVIDSLNGYLNAMPEERALTIQLHELLTYLNDRGVATFIVAAQTGLMGPNMESPIEASYLADAVIMLRISSTAAK